MTINKTLPSTFNFGCYGNLYGAKLDATGMKYSITEGGSENVIDTYPYHLVKQNVEEGSWTIVLANENKPKKSLPSTFKFKYGERDNSIYTAAEDTEGDFHVTWNGVNGEHGMRYTRKQVECSLKSVWHIVEEDVLKCEKDDIKDDTQGETANIPPNAVASIYEPLSFLMGAMSQQADKACEECYEEIDLLDYLREFTATTDAEVIISKGEYIVYYEGADYKACCDEVLLGICDAITTLHMASN